ncbi:hypothetical protein [Nitratidesulfovibrio liaohensis]|uniref:Uncharacterized protein n=1 Tax=Nitratidesulfovibrio liaohensis TaxID=2604158 RepID=A0ABY9QYU3_9BACT|nr:hypothetical protein [Nitratidesulfovibrio liaohensis]WMW64701.1 hypothetical protein KPS_002760 [Nitratidesulfovibrio liaohensis]
MLIVAQQFLPAGGQEQFAGVDVPVPHAVAGAFKGELPALFAVHQGHFGGTAAVGGNLEQQGEPAQKDHPQYEDHARQAALAFGVLHEAGEHAALQRITQPVQFGEGAALFQHQQGMFPARGRETGVGGAVQGSDAVGVDAQLSHQHFRRALVKGPDVRKARQGVVAGSQQFVHCVVQPARPLFEVGAMDAGDDVDVARQLAFCGQLSLQQVGPGDAQRLHHRQKAAQAGVPAVIHPQQQEARTHQRHDATGDGDVAALRDDGASGHAAGPVEVADVALRLRCGG